MSGRKTSLDRRWRRKTRCATRRHAAATSSRSPRWSNRMSAELHYRPLAELAGMLAARRVSAVELTAAAVARTRAVDGSVRAFNSFDESDALAQARASDERRARGGALGPLDGIPIGLKDVIAVRGQPLTASSRMLQ